MLTPQGSEIRQTRLLRPETYSIDRVIDKPAHDAANLLLNSLTQHRDRVSAVAIERAGTPTLFEVAVRELWPDLIPQDATQIILEPRKPKEADEIAEIRESLGLITVVYDAARAAIKPGRAELDIYNEMRSTVTQKAGTFVHLHGDFATGERPIRGGGLTTSTSWIFSPPPTSTSATLAAHSPPELQPTRSSKPGKPSAKPWRLGEGHKARRQSARCVQRNQSPPGLQLLASRRRRHRT